METDRDAAERERRQERQLSLLYLLAILLSCLLAAVVLLDSPKYGPTEFFTMSAPITYGERDLLDAPVNLNTADAAELDLLPGIGETLAGRILEYREQIGGFIQVEQLLEVQGIGEKTLKKLRPYVEL